MFCIFFFRNFILFFSLLAYFTIKKMQDFYYCADFYCSLFLSILIYFVFVRISQPHILLLFQKVSIGTILTMSILFQYRFFFFPSSPILWIIKVLILIVLDCSNRQRSQMRYVLHNNYNTVGSEFSVFNGCYLYK